MECGSEFRAEVVHLGVGSSDLEQIHEKKVVIIFFQSIIRIVQ